MGLDRFRAISDPIKPILVQPVKTTSRGRRKNPPWSWPPYRWLCNNSPLQDRAQGVVESLAELFWAGTPDAQAAERSFGADRKHIADGQRPDHEHRIDRWTTNRTAVPGPDRAAPSSTHSRQSRWRGPDLGARRSAGSRHIRLPMLTLGIYVDGMATHFRRTHV